jgi:hypothetical protein
VTAGVYLHARRPERDSSVNIKFLPSDPKWPADRPVLTNVGEFRPGQILNMQPWQEKEAKRLIDNGDFAEAFDAPAAEEAKPAPEVQEEKEIEGQISGKKSKK